MKKNKGTIAALVIVGALVAFTVWDAKRIESTERESREAKALFKVEADRIAKIEIADERPARILEKKDGVWHLVAPISDRADMLEVTPTLEAIQNETAIDLVSENVSELSRYGLDEPGLTATVTDLDGNIQVVKYGTVSGLEGNLYVQRGNEPKVFMVGSGLETHLSKELTDWRDKRLYRGIPDRLFTSIELEQRDSKGNPKPSIVLSKGEKGWTMKDYDVPLEVPAIEAFVEQVRALRAMDFFEFGRDDAKGRASLRLDAPRIKVTLSDGKGDAYWVEIGPPIVDADKAPHAAASSDLPGLVKIFGAAVTTLEKRPEDFLDRKSPFKYQVNDATRVEITAPRTNPPYEAVFEKKEAGKWVLVSSKTSGGGLQKDFDGTKLNDVLTRMSVLEAVRFLEPVQGSKAQFDSSIRLFREDGVMEFELRWGKPTTASTTADDPEATYVPATTSSSKRIIGIPQASLEGLGIMELASK